MIILSYETFDFPKKLNREKLGINTSIVSMEGGYENTPEEMFDLWKKWMMGIGYSYIKDYDLVKRKIEDDSNTTTNS